MRGQMWVWDKRGDRNDRGFRPRELKKWSGNKLIEDSGRAALKGKMGIWCLMCLLGSRCLLDIPVTRQIVRWRSGKDLGWRLIFKSIRKYAHSIKSHGAGQDHFENVCSFLTQNVCNKESKESKVYWASPKCQALGSDIQFLNLWTLHHPFYRCGECDSNRLNYLLNNS